MPQALKELTRIHTLPTSTLTPTSWCFFEIMTGLPVTIGLLGTFHKFLANTNAKSREWPHHMVTQREPP
ncbi:hypothetical protein [Bradyrhizobium sp. LB14.3]|uniref:hypothetical protein n=1 Tax=Bradyrhizobium sp. LB14.3 TaxID=3156328 RepID=UPI00339432DB